MGKKEFYVLAVLTVVSGFLGGMVSGRILPAQAQTKVVDEIRATNVIVDGTITVGGPDVSTRIGNDGVRVRKNGDQKSMSLFYSKETGPTLNFYDENQKTRMGLSISPTFDQKPNVVLYDENQNARAILGASQTESKSSGKASPRPESSLVLLDEKGDTVFKKP